MTRCRLFAFWPLLLLSCSTGLENSSPRASAIQLEPCQLSAPDLPRRVEARCGRLSVAENRKLPAGRRIELHLAVLPAVSRAASPDPLFFLTGGPGQAATESFVLIEPAFRRLNKNRDIVLVDQRGTGRSHPLRCPKLEEEPYLLALSEEQAASWVRSCLEKMDADPRFYTTSVAMQDLDDVRAALGYDRINIYGVSYGTRAALSYIRQFPDRVRTAILDGVAPPSSILGMNVAQDAQQALNMILARCAADATCNSSFPELAKHFEALMSRLQNGAVPINLDHPRTREPIEMRFSSEMAAMAVRLLSYAPETIALLPLIIHSAWEGDYVPLAGQYLIVTDSLERSISDGMNYSILCAEDFPFFDQADIEERNKNTYLGNLQTEALRQVCRVWPSEAIAPAFKEPVLSDIPVLLLSGEFDPVTPASNAVLAARSLPNSLHIIAPGQGHNVILRGCIFRLAGDFIESATLGNLDTECVSEIKPAPFFSSFLGPQP